MTQMAALLIALVLAWVPGSLTPDVALGGCSTQDRIGLVKAGYTKPEVEDLCQGGQHADVPSMAHPQSILDGEGQVRWQQWCITPQGRCPLNPKVGGFYPVGFPCNCYMPWGFYSGIAE